jgi:DNA recombination protein RmuC
MGRMQFALLIVCLLAGVLLAWLLLRGRSASLEAALRAREETNRALEQRLDTLIAREAELSARLESERSAAQQRQAQLEGQASGQAAELRELRERITTLSASEASLAARLEGESSAVEEKLKVLADAEHKLTEAFKAISADALSRNNQTFLDLAKAKLAEAEATTRGDLERRHQAIAELVTPVHASLAKVDEKIQHLETAREGAYSELREQVRNLGENQTKLQQETSKLVTALRAPAVRGRWGEIQLQRVVEMAGMLEYCDFFTQATVEGEDGRLRPDLIVRLPGGKSIVVDAKAPLSAYLQAIEEPDETARRGFMQNHATQVRTHLQALGRKSYADQFQPAPDFVVLFLPGESFFSAALENDPSLIEFGLDQNVIMATPTTLIALLRTAAYGWQQESLARNAAEISELGKQLYRRLVGMQDHWTKVGLNLNRAVEAYNKASGSLESRVLVSARRFEDLKTAPIGFELATPTPIERTARLLFDDVVSVDPAGLPAPETGADDTDPFADFGALTFAAGASARGVEPYIVDPDELESLQ